MKTKELKRIAKENDYELNKSLEHYKLTHKYYDNYISINGLYKNRLWISIPFFCDERDFNMIKAAVEFAETPPEDREEEKKFYLRHRWIRDYDFYMYLQKRFYDKKMSFGVINFNGYDSLQFTLKEIEEIKEKFNTDLKDFELVEVEE